MFLDITDHLLMEQEKARFEAQNIYLQEEIRSERNFVEIVGNSRPLLARFATERLAQPDEEARRRAFELS